MRLAEGQVRVCAGRLCLFDCSSSSKHPKGMQAMMKMKKLDIAELERAVRS